MTQIGYVCNKCGSTILQEKIDLLIDSEIATTNKEVDGYNKLGRIEYEEQKKEFLLIYNNLKKLYISRYPKYSFEYDNIRCSLHNGSSWHVFKEDELFNFNFIPHTKLYMARNVNDKPEAYFCLSMDFKSKKEDRYVICPLCSAKNYLPLKQLCLR